MTEKRPLRIGFLCDGYLLPKAEWRGGIVRLVGDLVRALAARGHVVWIIDSYTEGEPGPGPVIDGVRTLRVRTRRGQGRKPGGYLSLLAEKWTVSRALRSLARSEELELVEICDWMGSGCFYHFPVRAPCPLVVRLHGSQSAYAQMLGRKNSRLTRWIERRTLAAADFLVAVSESIAGATRECFALGERKIATIHNFVDLQAFAAPPGVVVDPNLLLYAGMVNGNKGLPELFAALPEIFRARPEARLEIAGGDSNEGPGGTSLLESLVSDLPAGMRGRVVHHGPLAREDLPALYARAAACVFPSMAEAFGLVVVEALAAGGLVVASSRVGHAEIIEHERSGLLCDPEDTAGLAREVLRALSDAELAARLRRAAQERAALFDVERVADKNVEFYRRCLGRRGGTRGDS